MQETVKKRAWVKDAAIIFLAVMLVLTFFSNTFLNRSLPEVASAYVQSGSIDSKVRITGTVTAKDNYDVVLEQSRKVDSVLVRVGQEVSAGDVLFTLEEGDSEELDAAKEALYSLELQYQKALINADNNNYEREKRNIELAKAAVERAQSKYDMYALSLSELAALERDLTAAQRSYDEASIGVKNSSDSSGGGGGASSDAYNRLNAANAAVTSAQNDLNAARLAYGDDYKTLIKQALKEIVVDKNIDTSAAGGADAYVENNIPKDQNGWPTDSAYSSALPFYLENLVSQKGSGDPLKKAYEKISAAESALATAKEAQASAQAAINDANSWGDYVPGKSYNGKTHQQWLKLQSEAEVKLDQLKTRKSNYETAFSELNSAEETLRNLEDALSDAQKNDKLEALDLQEMQRSIQKAREKVEKLSGGEGGLEIKAKNGGTVESLNVSAGHKFNAGDVLVSIQIPDRGYTITSTVTNEQARLLHVGDAAEVSNYYWGSSTKVELVSMVPDPKSPQSGKLCTFDVSGNVSAGSQLNFAIGAKNASYDYVVPNSAVRSDTNGSFVLVITAKNSPLGNRYYASRVDVEVIASDDMNSALKGALNNMDSVITTASKNTPVAPGDQVRLPDVN